MSVRGKPPPPPGEDDDPYLEWSGPSGRDTEVQLTPEDLEALETEEVTPTRGPESLPGYELGRQAERVDFFARWDYLLAGERRQGAVEILNDLRDELVRQWNDQAFVDEFVRRMALKRGIKLG